MGRSLEARGNNFRQKYPEDQFSVSQLLFCFGRSLLSLLSADMYLDRKTSILFCQTDIWWARRIYSAKEISLSAGRSPEARGINCKSQRTWLEPIDFSPFVLLINSTVLPQAKWTFKCIDWEVNRHTSVLLRTALLVNRSSRTPGEGRSRRRHNPRDKKS